MPFNIDSYPEPRIIDVDGDDYEEFRYTGAPVDSFFHSAGWLLDHAGRFAGNAATLRRLTATAIAQIYEAGAAPMAEVLIRSLGFSSVETYVTAIANGTQAGDLLCLIALEFHFNVHFDLYERNGPSTRVITHLSPIDCRTRLILQLTGGAFSPIEMHELPALEALEYCLTCGIGHPPEGESICDNCVRRPKFCTSCGIAFVESETTVCSFCTKRLSTALVRQSRSIGPTDFETVVSTCRANRETGPVEPVVAVVEEPPRFVLYLSNAPFDDFRSGDGTYMNKIVNWVRARNTVVMNGLTYKVAAFRLCDATIAKNTPLEEQGVPLAEIPYIKGWPTSQTETEAMTMAAWEKFYGPARELFLKMLIEARANDKNPKSVHIFHAQVRYPDSGALFNAQFFKALKKAGFRVVVTCHEMEFNLLTPKNMQKTIVQMNEFVAEAERTIFLNEYDLLLGAGLIETSSLSAYVREHYSEELADKVDLELGNLLAVETINPKGIAEDSVDIPPIVKQTFFHVPGIATVGGAPFTAEEVLRRPKNVLVFGLIKQKEAMDAAADVANELFKRRIEAKVFVVGKVFKDYQHTAIARLVRKMCFMSEKEERAVCAMFDDFGRQARRDADFYELLDREIRRQVGMYAFKRLVVEARRASDVARTGVLEVVPLCRAALQYLVTDPALAVQAELGKIETAFGELGAATHPAEAILGSAADVNPLVGILHRIENAVNALGKLLPPPVNKKPVKKPMSTSSENAIVAEIVPGQQERDAAGAAVERFKFKMTCRKTLAALVANYVPNKPLPIEIVFDAPPELFQKIAGVCQYAFKVDLKSMADNASSILSLMANGCITFTESRFDTPDEFRVDKTGGKLSPVIMPPNHKGTCSGKFVADEIARRELDPSLNRATLKNMLTLLKKRYGIDAVAGKHMQVYKTLFPE